VVMFILGILVGFAIGYTVREFISQQRQAVARNKRHVAERTLSRQDHIDRLKLMATHGVTRLAEDQSGGPRMRRT
jgi:hypothetical protein